MYIVYIVLSWRSRCRCVVCWYCRRRWRRCRRRRHCCQAQDLYLTGVVVYVTLLFVRVFMYFYFGRQIACIKSLSAGRGVKEISTKNGRWQAIRTCTGYWHTHTHAHSEPKTSDRGRKKIVFYKVCAHMLLSGFQHLERTKIHQNQRKMERTGAKKKWEKTAGIAVIFDGRIHSASTRYFVYKMT